MHFGAYNGFGYDAANRTTALTVTDNNVSSMRPITHDAEGRIIGLVAGAVRTTVFTYSATQPNELVQQHTKTLGVSVPYTDDDGAQGEVLRLFVKEYGGVIWCNDTEPHINEARTVRLSHLSSLPCL